jgi:hypothetical protein
LYFVSIMNYKEKGLAFGPILDRKHISLTVRTNGAGTTFVLVCKGDRVTSFLRDFPLSSIAVIAYTGYQRFLLVAYHLMKIYKSKIPNKHTQAPRMAADPAAQDGLPISSQLVALRKGFQRPWSSHGFSY